MLTALERLQWKVLSKMRTCLRMTKWLMMGRCWMIAEDDEGTINNPGQRRPLIGHE